jgi:hypothetical protein
MKCDATVSRHYSSTRHCRRCSSDAFSASSQSPGDAKPQLMMMVFDRNGLARAAGKAAADKRMRIKPRANMRDVRASSAIGAVLR